MQLQFIQMIYTLLIGFWTSTASWIILHCLTVLLYATTNFLNKMESCNLLATGGLRVAECTWTWSATLIGYIWTATLWFCTLFEVLKPILREIPFASLIKNTIMNKIMDGKTA